MSRRAFLLLIMIIEINAVLPWPTGVLAQDVVLPPVYGQQQEGSDDGLELLEQGTAAYRGNAVILRASRIAIPQTLQDLARRVQQACAGLEGTSAFLEHFTKGYLADTRATARTLNEMGYRVVPCYSSDYSDGAAFKRALRQELEKDETKVLVIFGHGDRGNGIELFGRSEYAVVEPREIDLLGHGESRPTFGLTADEISQWLGERRLDVLITQCCNGAYQTYLSSHEIEGHRPRGGLTRWDQLVSENGLFAGWNTYSVYFNPNTSRYLRMYRARLGMGIRRKDIVCIRTGDFLRSLGLLAGHDHGEVYWQAICADQAVVVHEENPDPLFANLIALATALRNPETTLLSDVRRFLAVHSRQLAAGELTGQPVTSRGTLGPRASAEAVSRYVNDHAQSVVTAALDAVVPNLTVPRQARVAFDGQDENLVHLELRFTISRNNTSLQEACRLLSGQLPAVGGIDGAAIRRTVERVARRLPEFDVELSCEVRKHGGSRPARFSAVVTGYRIIVGHCRRQALTSTAPYQLHFETAAINGLVKVPMEELFSREAQVFSRFGTTGYLKLDEFVGINTNWQRQDEINIEARWQFRLDYPLGFDDGYAYARTNVVLRVATLGRDSFTVTPTITLTLEDGWSPRFQNAAMRMATEQAVHWMVTTGVRETFSVLAGRLNGYLDGALRPYLTTVNGTRQHLQVTRVTRPSASVLVGHCSPIGIKVGDLIPATASGARLQREVVDRVRLQAIETGVNRLSVLIGRAGAES